MNDEERKIRQIGIDLRQQLGRFAKIDPEFKKRWLNALRSGEYKQARSTLRRDDNFCCIGVACDLIDPEGWQEPADDGMGGTGRGWRSSREFEIPVFAEQFVNCERYFDNVDGVLKTLSAMNDSGFTFEQIADLIEEIPADGEEA